MVEAYRYWRRAAIVADVDTRRHPFHVAIENFQHDHNIGTVVRTANAFAAEHGLDIVAVDNAPGSVPPETVTLPRECVLLFGQEGPGLSQHAREAAALVVSIAQFGTTRSIDAGVAAGIVMHNWVRQHADLGLAWYHDRIRRKCGPGSWYCAPTAVDLRDKHDR